jgi:hypothetical protein
MGWAASWVTFSQTHLVTLVEKPRSLPTFTTMNEKGVENSIYNDNLL